MGSFLFGENKQNSNVTKDTRGGHAQLLKALFGEGYEGILKRLFPTSEVNPEDAKPYQDLFTLQDKTAFGQAKESAGNLTGSGFANILGNKAGEASTAHGAFLADLFERRRMQDQSVYANTILGALGSPAGGVTTTHQPGFLDYAAQGAAAAAPAFGAGGLSFGSLGLGGGGGGSYRYPIQGGNVPAGPSQESYRFGVGGHR